MQMTEISLETHHAGVGNEVFMDSHDSPFESNSGANILENIKSYMFSSTFLNGVGALKDNGNGHDEAFRISYRLLNDDSFSAEFLANWNTCCDISSMNLEDVLNWFLAYEKNPFPSKEEWEYGKFQEVTVSNTRFFSAYKFKHPQEKTFSGLATSVRELEHAIAQLGVEEPWFHGTNIESAWNIVNQGINLQVNAGKKSFGSGFYLTNNLFYACKFADDCARRTRHGTRRPPEQFWHHDGGAVLIYDKNVVDNGRKIGNFGVPYSFQYSGAGFLEWEQFVKYNFLDVEFQHSELLNPPSLIIGPTTTSGSDFFAKYPDSRVLFAIGPDGPITQACVKDSSRENKLWNRGLRAVIIYERKVYEN